MVIPCYRVRSRIGSVLASVGDDVWRIYCIDDGCPEGSGEAAKRAARNDQRFRLLTHSENQGVGGAIVTGYRQALADGADVIVKMDGDGQMDGASIGDLVRPLAEGVADYVKGNRFFHLDGLRPMPLSRLIGNAGLSFFSKLSSGYWRLFDPTNGFTAIHARVARALPLDRLSKGYFFESDLLFRLNTLRAVVADIPMPAIYDDETSNLSPIQALFSFPFKHLRNFVKRVFYNYFLRDFSIASVHFLLGFLLMTFGVVFGAAHWVHSAASDVFASSGTVMLAAVPVILGFQLLLAFVNYDTASVPRDPIHRRL